MYKRQVLWKQILLFALPIAATSMLQQLFNSADVAVVGQFSAQKELALAAVGSTSSIVNLYITIFTGLAVGANVVIARLIGAEEEGEVRKAVHTSLVVAVLCGAVLMVVGECLAGPDVYKRQGLHGGFPEAAHEQPPQKAAGSGGTGVH